MQARPRIVTRPAKAAVAARRPACFEPAAKRRQSEMVKRGKAEKWAARGERLSAALRENLKRRKEQVRERGDLARNRPAGDVSTPENAEKETRVPDFRRNRGRE